MRNIRVSVSLDCGGVAAISPEFAPPASQRLGSCGFGRQNHMRERLNEVLVVFSQQFLSAFDAPFDQPSMRRHPDSAPERAGKMACG